MYTLIIILIISFIPIPVMAKYMINGRNPYRGLLEGIMSAVIGVTMVFLFSQVFTGITIFERMDMILGNVKASDMYMTNMPQMFGLGKLSQDELQQAMDYSREIMKLSLPGFIIIAASVIAYINYKIVSWILKKSGQMVSLLPPFRLFVLPKSAMLGSVLIYLLSYITSSSGLVDKDLIMYNVQMLFGFIFSVQGLSFMFYYSYIKHFPKLITLIVAGICIILPLGQTFLFILGLTDVAFDLRKKILAKISLK